MKPALRVQAYNKFYYIVLTAILGIISISMGSFVQDIAPGNIIIFIAFIIGWLVYSAFTSFSLHGSIVLLAVSFLKPAIPGFFFFLVLFLVLIVIETLQKQEFSLHIPYPIAFSLLLGFGVNSVLRVQNPFGYLYFCSSILIPVITLTLCQNARIGRNTMLLWMKSIVAVGAIVGLYGVYVAIRNPFDRLGSFWITAMTINGFYALALFFSITLLYYCKKGLHKVLYAISSLLILFGMLYTYTRIALIAVFFGLFLFAFRIRSMRYLGMMFVALIPLIIPASMTSRIEIGFLSSDVSLIIRGIAWYLALTLIYQNPIAGIGFGVWMEWYPTVIPVKFLYAQHVHNVYLNVLVEIGMIGGFAYFYVIFKSLYTYWRRMIRDGNDFLSFGIWASMMVLMLSCVTDIFIQQYSISILFWVSLGLALGQMRERYNE